MTAPEARSTHHRRSIRLKGYDYAQPGAYFVTICTWHRECLFGEVVDGEMHLSVLGKIVQDEWLRSIDIRHEICLYEDEFVIMPNHLHGIVWIVDIVVGADGIRPDGIRPDGIRPDGIRPDGIRPDGIRPDGIHPEGIHADGSDNDFGASERGELGRELTDQGASLAPLPTPQPAPLPTPLPTPQPALQPVPKPALQPAPQPPIAQRAPRSLSTFIAGFKASVTSRARRELGITPIWQRNYYEHIIRNETGWHRIWEYIHTNPSKWESDQLHPAAPPNPFNQDQRHGN